MPDNEVYPQERTELVNIILRLQREAEARRTHPPVREWFADMDCGCATVRGYGPPPTLGERIECPTERKPKDFICAVARVYWADVPPPIRRFGRRAGKANAG